MAKEKTYELAEQNDDLFENFDALAKHVQKTYRAPIKYEVDATLSLPPNPRIRIKITYPNGHFVHWHGKNKKEAANEYAQHLRPSDV